MAVSIFDGSSSSFWRSSGCSTRASIDWEMALRVVSLPATASNRKNMLNSIGPSRSPSTSAVSSVVTMSSAGALRFSAARASE